MLCMQKWHDTARLLMILVLAGALQRVQPMMLCMQKQS